jgi:hypothetical protein
LFELSRGPVMAEPFTIRPMKHVIARSSSDPLRDYRFVLNVIMSIRRQSRLTKVKFQPPDKLVRINLELRSNLKWRDMLVYLRK